MRGRRALVAAVAYLAATAYFTWPLVRLTGSHIFPRGSADDILLVLWILAWDVHALATDPTRLFSGNILHPASNVLARSEHLLGTLPAFGPAFVATQNPVLGMNVMMCASFVLGAVFMHALVWTWTRSTVAAYAAGLSFAFATWRINGLNWPHLLNTQYLPLLVLGVERTMTTHRLRWALLLSAALTLQLLASYYLAYMAAIVFGTFVVASAFRCSQARSRDAWIALSVALLLPTILLVAVSTPYLRADEAGVLRWSRADDRLLDGLAMLGGPSFVLRGFVGWGPTVLAVFALVGMVIGSADRVHRLRMGALVALLACALAVSPGPRGLFGGAISVYSWLESVLPRIFARPHPIPVRDSCELRSFGVGGDRRLEADGIRPTGATGRPMSVGGARRVPRRLPCVVYERPIRGGTADWGSRALGLSLAGDSWRGRSASGVAHARTSA